MIPNTGQLPKYLIQNHHEGIVSRETFDAVQLEMARRNAKAGATRKSTPTGRGKYSGKHVLSNLLFCGECGTAYRRCVWTQRGIKRPVWRCVSRLDYGKKFCTQSPTLDEEPLQQAILAAVNAVMLDRDTLARQLTAVMEWELAPMLGESMSLADIDGALEELSSQFNSLLAEASANPAEDYTERFRELSESTARLKERKAQLEGACQEQGRLQNRLRAVSAAMEHMTAAMTEWDEEVVHQLLEKVTVLSREKIRVTFRDGREIEQAVNQPKKEVYHSMKIFATGDTHGNFERFRPEYFPEGLELTKEDVVLQLGDFGGVWFGDERDDESLDWLEGLPFTVAFVSGNHENYDALVKYPIENWHGGRVRPIRPHVLHLMRGQVFELAGRTFFTMGGAASHDIEDGILSLDDPGFERKYLTLKQKEHTRFRIEHLSWWREELPSEEEYAEARKNLDAYGWAVDYILTHCAPTGIALQLSWHNVADHLTDFLQEVKDRAQYHYWLFGHYHDNRAIDTKHILLWEQIVQIL